MDDVIDGIARELVESSNIASIGYSPERAILAVEFKSGSIVHYKSVPADLALDFWQAESKGQFYSAYIKRKFPGDKMTGPCKNCGINGVIGTRCTDCGTGEHVLATERRKDDGQSETQFSL
jgi:hypothetical protein